jgi:glycosyltransferase involved in cell wall biosynthesis
MKIMQLFYYPGQGGAEQYAYLLAKEAKKDGHETIFIFSEEGPFIEKVEKLGCKVMRVKMRSPFDPLAIKELAAIFKTEKPDIVQTHFLRENFLTISASKFAPVSAIFTTVHRIEPKTIIQAKFNKFYSRGLSKFIAVSEVVKDYLLEEGIKESKIVIVPNGVEIGKFDKAKVRKEIGITAKDQIVSSVARFTEEKGQLNLIKAFSKIKNKNAKLVLVGDGELLEKAKKAAKSERIIFTGGRDKGYEIVGISNLYIQPSKRESFGMSVVEAMMQKIPVLLPDIPAFKYLTKDGKNGELYPSGKVNILAEKIDALLKKPDQTKVKEAYKFVSERFTSEIMWKKTKSLYEHTLKLSAFKK